MDDRIASYRRTVEQIGRGDLAVRVENRGDDELGRLGVAIDIMARSLELRFGELQRLVELTTRVNAGVLLDEVLHQVFHAFRDVIPFDRLGLALLDPDGVTARAVWSRTIHDGGSLSLGYTADIRNGSLLQIVETGEPRIINDLEAYLRDHPESDSTRLMLVEHIRASLTCPLVASGRPVGFLFFSSSEPSCYARAHVDFYRKIAAQLAWVIEKSRLYEGLLRAQDELAEANRKLEHLAAVDGLTELANRRALNSTFENEWARALRKGCPIALVIFDVDDFKACNDAYGHLLGDGVLRAVARTLKSHFRRSSDLVARFGGEEFAVLLPELEAKNAVALAERARQAIEAMGIPHSRARAVLRLTVSGGVAAMVPRHGTPSGTLLAAADSALYDAKQRGRNQVALYDKGDDPTIRPPPPSLPPAPSQPPGAPPSRPSGAPPAPRD